MVLKGRLQLRGKAGRPLSGRSAKSPQLKVPATSPNNEKEDNSAYIYKWSKMRCDGCLGIRREHACVVIGMRTTASYCVISSRSEDYTVPASLSLKESTQTREVAFKVSHHLQGKTLCNTVYYNILSVNAMYIQ